MPAFSDDRLAESPASAPTAPVPVPPRPDGTAQLLALQQSAGNQAVARMLSRSEQTVAASPGERVASMLADADGTAIRDITDEEIAAATAQQRAGLIRVLSDLMWTSYAEEEATLRILRHGGKHAEVVAALDVLGYRQQVLDSVDDAALHAELEQLLGAPAAAEPPGPIADALAAQSADAVLALDDLSQATPAQRLGLLRILLELSWSTAAEEAKMIDILESGDVAALMADVAAAGLKQALFDHIDDATQAQRFTELIGALHDPELDRDLEVFNQSFFGGMVETVVGGVASAVENFSPGALIMGVLHPILHPIDTLVGLFTQVLDFAKNPSLDRAVTFLRDLTGLIGLWLGLLALALGGAAALLGLATVPVVVAVGAVVGTIAGYIGAVAAANGIAFLVFSVLKLQLDMLEGGAATTGREREEQVKEVGESITLLAVVGLFAGLVRGLKWMVETLRGTATDPLKAEPDALDKTASETRKGTEDATRRAQELKDEARVDEGVVPEVPRSPTHGCFVTGTLVLTPAGLVPIEALRAGNVVHAYDSTSGAAVPATVTAVHAIAVPEVLEITAGQTTILVTAEHPFWVPGAGWRRAGDLSEGTPLLTHAGTTVAVAASARRPGSTTVHNLTVDGVSTYFVSGAGVLVHNKGGGRASPPTVAELPAAKTAAQARAVKQSTAAQEAAARAEAAGDSAAAAEAARLAEEFLTIRDSIAEAATPEEFLSYEEWLDSSVESLGEILNDHPAPAPEPVAEPEEVFDERPARPVPERIVDPTDFPADPGPFKVPVPRSGGKVGATDVDPWVKGLRPRQGESGRAWAERILRLRYPDRPTFDTGPTSEWNQIKKYGDRHFRDP